MPYWLVAPIEGENGLESSFSKATSASIKMAIESSQIQMRFLTSQSSSWTEGYHRKCPSLALVRPYKRPMIFLEGRSVSFAKKTMHSSYTLYRDLRCPEHGLLLPQELSPRHFSFNTRLGSCPKCEGLGRCMDIELDKLFPEPKKSIWQGMHGWARTAFARSKRTKAIVACLFEHFETKTAQPFQSGRQSLRMPL